MSCFPVAVHHGPAGGLGAAAAAVPDVRQRLHAVDVGGPGAGAAAGAVHDAAAVGHGGRGDDAARGGHVVEHVVRCRPRRTVTVVAARAAGSVQSKLRGGLFSKG